MTRVSRRSDGSKRRFLFGSVLVVGAAAALAVASWTPIRPLSLSSKRVHSRDGVAGRAFHSVCRKLPFSAAIRTASLPASAVSSGQVATARQVRRTSWDPLLLVDVKTGDFSQCVEQWTARMKAATALLPAGVFLDAVDNRNISVETLTIRLPRSPEAPGLGLQLLEVASSKAEDSGLGITIIESCVPNGPADLHSQQLWLLDPFSTSTFLPGDSISQIAVVVGTRAGSATAMEQATESTAASVECFDYDKTVDTIVNMPPVRLGVDDAVTEEYWAVTIKRLRQRPKISVRLEYPPSQKQSDATAQDTTIELFAGENLRRALLTRGVKLNDPLASRFDSGGTGNCGAEGTCATCTVNIRQGGQNLYNAPSLQEQQMVQKVHPTWRLACKAVVGNADGNHGEMTIRVNPRQWND
jgi:ferredoxin